MKNREYEYTPGILHLSVPDDDILRFIYLPESFVSFTGFHPHTGLFGVPRIKMHPRPAEAVFPRLRTIQ